MIVECKELGRVKFIPIPRAKRVTVRYRSGVFHVSHPEYLSKEELNSILYNMKARLLTLKANALPLFVFTEETNFETLTFKVVIQKGKLNNTYVAFREGTLFLTFPEAITLIDQHIQAYIKEEVEKKCRSEANKLLPEKVKLLASMHNFHFNKVKINNSRGRWGSCSSSKNINLSYFCMMLPTHLVDFVILHELCHTREMNHGKDFWALLDAVTGNRAVELTQELKNYKLRW